jgi:hypothetical protein
VVASHGINGYRDIHRAIPFRREKDEFGSRRMASLAKYRAGLFAFGLDDFFAAVETAWADVMTQMRLASGRLDGQCRVGQEIMCTMHSAFRRGLFVLLNCHFPLLNKPVLLL